MSRLSGKFALVTGAATGIGRAIAIRFAREGASVAMNYYDQPEKAEEAADEVRHSQREGGHEGARVLTIQADVSKEDDVQRMFEAALQEFGRLDILVNNAGIQMPSPSHELSTKDFDRVLAVNLRGAFLCSREAMRHFLSRPGGGAVVNNSSVHEIIPKPFFLGYSVSKGGMQNLTRTLALEYADRGIRVNAVGPGAIVTPINDSWIHDPKARAEVESRIPMGRAGEPAEIAAVCAFLASDEASYITGQTLYACGGLTIYPEYRANWAS